MCRARTVLFAVVAALTIATPARADDWAATFPAERVVTWLGEGPRGVIVVPAGSEEPGVQAAAAALLASLRGSEAVRLAMDSAAIGSAYGLEDAAIVAKAEALPVDVVAIVRVFPGAADAPGTAVVTLYQKDGTALSAFSGAPGAPIAARTADESAGAGVGAKAAESVAAVSRTLREDQETAQKEYDQRVVGFDHGILVTPHTAVSVLFPYQGTTRRPLEGDAFYEAIERPDLAERYRSRSAARTWTMVGGIVVSVAGASMVIADVVGNMDSNTPFTALGYTGLALGAVGPIVTVIGASIEPHPISGEEAQHLGEEYNLKLRERLGLEAPRVTQRLGLELGLSLGPTPGGGGVSLNGRF